jgi:hypothetical protein
VANTGLVRYRYEAGVPRLVVFNATDHLDERAAPVTKEPDATSVDA